MKTKVIERLIKNGNNENEVLEMVSLHFELASSKFNTVKEISNFIRKIY